MKILKKLLCNLLRHDWKYFFTQSDSYTQRTDVRVCRCCENVQQYKRIISFENKEEYIWMNMVGYTKRGAIAHHGKNIEL